MDHILTDGDLRRITTDVPWAVIDWETGGRTKAEAVHPILSDPIGLAILTPKGYGYVPFHKTATDDCPTSSPGEVGPILAQLFRQSVPIINWNQKFDQHLEERVAQVAPSNVVDPMVGLWLLSETSPLGLKGSLSDLTQAHFPDFTEILKMAAQEASERISRQREEYAQLQKASGQSNLTRARRDAIQIFPISPVGHYDIPVSILAPYAIRDVVATALIWFGYVRPSLQREGLLTYFYRYEMPFLQTLYRMEHRGIQLDLGACRDLAIATLAEVTDTASQIYQLVGREINLNATGDLIQVLFSEMGFPLPERRTERGNISLDEKVLKDLLWVHQNETKIFDLILAYRKAKKLHSTYAESLPDWAVDGVVHTRYNQTGTTTGRLSSDSPNLQNQAKDKRVKGMWRAREGKTLISADLSQAELRTLAHLTQDPALLDVYRSGGDLHARTQARFGIENRTIAKNANFGMVYGVGPTTFREGLLYDAGVRISEEEARAYIDGLYDLYAAINPWKKRVIAAAREVGYVETLLGRRRHLPELLGNQDISWGERAYAERQAVNSVIQGGVGDLMRIAMLRCEPIFEQFGGGMLLQVHDEILGEVDTSCLNDACRAIRKVMQDLGPTFDFSVPILSDVETGPDWGHLVEWTDADVPAAVAG